MKAVVFALFLALAAPGCATLAKIQTAVNSSPAVSSLTQAVATDLLNGIAAALALDNRTPGYVTDAVALAQKELANLKAGDSWADIIRTAVTSVFSLQGSPMMTDGIEAAVSILDTGLTLLGA